MKIFKDVLEDIKKLVGIRINSIRAGAEITIEEIDVNSNRIKLRTSKEKVRSRPLSELEHLWQSLCKKPAIHVDAELGGSGSSRNQPETILANLPYIEWFRYLGKKHLKLIESDTHNLGTLKKMDAITVEEIKLELVNSINISADNNISEVVIISGNISGHAETMEQITGLKAKTIQQGIYEYFLYSCRILLVSEKIVKDDISLGTYFVVKGKSLNKTNKSLKIGDQIFTLISSHGLCLLSLKEE